MNNISSKEKNLYSLLVQQVTFVQILACLNLLQSRHDLPLILLPLVPAVNVAWRSG